MTEAEWLACTEPQHLFYALELEPVSSRKLRLFARACCQLLWHLLTDERGRTRAACSGNPPGPRRTRRAPRGGRDHGPR